MQKFSKCNNFTFTKAIIALLKLATSRGDILSASRWGGGGGGGGLGFSDHNIFINSRTAIAGAIIGLLLVFYNSKNLNCIGALSFFFLRSVLTFS